MKIIHLITGLGGGGAESMLYKLLQFSDRTKYDIEVISMLDLGVYGERIEQDLNIKVHTLNLSKASLNIKAIIKCLTIVKDCDLIQCWMYHANLFGMFIGKVVRKKIVWGVHHSDLSRQNNKITTIWIAKFSSLLSPFVDQVVSCGYEVKKVHDAIGYSKKNNIVIPNGFDVEKFSPNLKYQSTDILFSQEYKYFIHVGRWDPLKDYENLLAGISILKESIQSFRLLLVGTDINEHNKELMGLISYYEVDDYVTLLGRREDIPLLMANADFLVLSSRGEGFPNVLGEALCSGTLCVTTDTGDCKIIVNQYGGIVRPENPRELAQSLQRMLNLQYNEYRDLTISGREWIIEHFEIGTITKKYEEVYKNLIRL